MNEWMCLQTHFSGIICEESEELENDSIHYTPGIILYSVYCTLGEKCQ